MELWRRHGAVVLAAKDSSETDGMLMPPVCGHCQSANHQRTTRTNLPKWSLASANRVFSSSILVARDI